MLQGAARALKEAACAMWDGVERVTEFVCAKVQFHGCDYRTSILGADHRVLLSHCVFLSLCGVWGSCVLSCSSYFISVLLSVATDVIMKT